MYVFNQFAAKYKWPTVECQAQDHLGKVKSEASRDSTRDHEFLNSVPSSDTDSFLVCERLN